MTNFFLPSQQNLSSPYKKFCQAKSNNKLFCWFTNRFVGKTENFLGKQKSFVSSISTIWLVNTTIFFLRVIIRHNIGPISADNSRLLLLGQCRRLHQSSAGMTTATFVDCLNLPTFSQNLAEYRPYTKPIVTFTIAFSSESRRARVRPMDGTLLGHVSLLPKQTILEVRKPEFGTASACCCAENKCWRPEFGPELATKCIPELSFQQRHDIGNQFDNIFADAGPVLGRI